MVHLRLTLLRVLEDQLADRAPLQLWLRVRVLLDLPDVVSPLALLDLLLALEDLADSGLLEASLDLAHQEDLDAEDRPADRLLSLPAVHPLASEAHHHLAALHQDFLRVDEADPLVSVDSRDCSR